MMAKLFLKNGYEFLWQKLEKLFCYNNPFSDK